MVLVVLVRVGRRPDPDAAAGVHRRDAVLAGEPLQPPTLLPLGQPGVEVFLQRGRVEGLALHLAGLPVPLALLEPPEAARSRAEGGRVEGGAASKSEPEVVSSFHFVKERGTCASALGWEGWCACERVLRHRRMVATGHPAKRAR